MKQAIDRLFDTQLNEWAVLAERLAALKQTKNKSLHVGNSTYRIQYNPLRSISATASVDKASIELRKCFLCTENRPAIQKGIPFKNHYTILVNPFPILPKHLTIPDNRHIPQRFISRLEDMLDLAISLDEYVVFYNGPKCGASAPDHFHFQAGSKGELPIEQEWKSISKDIIRETEGNKLWLLNDSPRTAFVIEATDRQSACILFDAVYESMPKEKETNEPMMNIVAWVEEERFIVCIIPRAAHRPSCYFAKDDKALLVSPGALDMAGLLITVREEDFQRINPTNVQTILSEIGPTPEARLKMLNKLSGDTSAHIPAPKVTVSILSGTSISFVLHTPYSMNGEEFIGQQTITYREGKVYWQGREYAELLFTPVHEQEAYFEVADVTIGINFHWERKEAQRFQGAFRIIADKDKLVGINIIDVEDYLTSVISSEMSATASLELLKAHAVISRSWLLAQIQKRNSHAENSAIQFTDTEDVRIRWYDREDHTLFDVCADDHCQRYQGITRASTQAVKEAIACTWGEVLTYNNEICDARFSKCCGGAFEEFQSCWEDTPHPYLRQQRDSKSDTALPDLSQEQEVIKWIQTSPEAFCHTTDKKILTQVLNNYDQETVNFFRWQVSYTQEELSALIRRRSGIDFGDIIDLIPIERGTSGRLIKLKIVGSKRTMIIGKELEIRRTFSESHLYSSAFIVKKEEGTTEIPTRFTLIGAGWGHGVGLCQIGAAVMGEQGYGYAEILSHYYLGSEIDRRY